MVRVISEKLFSPPRSRHSSGEAVDKELAARAVEALSSLNSSRRPVGLVGQVVAELSDYESSSDSYWDESEVDVEGDAPDTTTRRTSLAEESSALVGECSGGEDVLQKRKERRRERNKLSAQAYRIRRREQCMKQQGELRELHDKNWRLREEIHTLEEEIDHIRRTAVVGPPKPPPVTTTPCSPSPAARPTPTPPPSDRPQCPQPPGSARQEERGCPPPPPQRRLMDNDLTRSRLLSPLLDNFPLQLSPAGSPAASPRAASSPSWRFSLAPPPTPSLPGAGHAASRSMAPGVSPEASVVPPATSVLMREQVPPHPQPQYPFQVLPLAAQHTDLNANAQERRSNLNVIHTAALGLSCQRNDNVNNNMDNNVSLAPPTRQGGARPKTKFGVPARSLGSSEVFKFP